MLILAIESSCDETAAAIAHIDDETQNIEIKASIIASQIDIHALYGGVVPEIASRAHAEALSKITYEALEKAIQYSEKIESIKEGDLLEIGDPYLFGGAKLVWGKWQIQLPDGSVEPINYDWFMGYCGRDLFYAMTAPRGWEWFNPVRNEDRYKEYVERVRKIADKK